MKSLLMAICLLTAIPLHGDDSASERDLARSVLFFPLVGLFVGFALMVIARLLLPVLAVGPLSAVVLLGEILLTGGLHLDGLADLCDGLAAGGGRERILAVMKDPHVGAFGVIGLVMILILKYSLFYEMISKGWFHAFLIMGLLSRWGMGLAAAFGRYAREKGTAKPFIGKVGWQQGTVMTGMTMVLSWMVMKGPGLFACLVIFLFLFIFVCFLKHRIGGLTGDTLGALNEITEVLVLLFIMMLSR